ncbi:MAG: hypothetical protein AAGJ93_08390, partial [Bacteroidota bacterium]
MYLIISSLTLVMFFTNCKRDQPEEGHLLSTIRLNCERLNESVADEQSAVYATLNESKVKLAEMDACQDVSPSQYAGFNIPGNALSAISGQSGNIYAVLEGKKLNFYISNTKNGDNYSPLATYTKKKFQLLRPLHLADLAGYYIAYNN